MGYYGFEYFLVFAAILFVRYFVWRGRYGKINEKLTNLEYRFSDLRAEMEAIAARNRGAVEGVSETRSSQTLESSKEFDDVASQEDPAPPTAAELMSFSVFDRSATVPLEAASLAEPLTQPKIGTPEGPTFRAAPARPTSRPNFMSLIRARVERAGGGAELEALIGGNWLNKIGVGALVLGMVLFIRYALAYVGPLGKVGLGVGLGLALLVGGIVLERRQRYALFARPLIGGGWALLYFTAYAAHNFDAARVIENPAVGLLVMIAVAGGMIFHSLRYRAEMVTGVAYVLAFLAIDISPLGLYSLLASALLALSLIVLLWRFAWYRLALGAVIATYGTHLLWMLGSTPTMPLPLPAFWITESILVLYWLTFATSDFLRLPENIAHQRAQLAITVLNAFAVCGLSVMLVDAAFPETPHVFIAAASIVAAVMCALLARTGRLLPSRFYGVFAGAAAALAIPLAIFSWSIAGEWLAIGWGGLAALITAVGLWRREVLFRAEAYVIGTMAAVAAAAIAIFAAGAPTLVASDSLILRWATVVSITTALLVGEWILVRFRDRLVEGEEHVGTFAGYAAAGLLAELIFRDADTAYLGIVWLVVGAAAAEIGLRIGHLHSRFRGYALMVAGFAALIVNNSNLLSLSVETLPAPYRWLVLLASAVIVFGTAWRLRTAASRATSAEIPFAALGIYAGAFLLAIVAWNALPTASVAVAWAFIALVLYEAGVRLPEPALRLAAYGLVATAWGRLALIDFVAIGAIGPISTRVLTVLPVAGLLYYFRHGAVETTTDGLGKLESRLPIFFSFAATIAIFALARFEFGRSDAVVAWSALAVVLLAVGVHTKHWEYRIQAYLVALAAFARSWSTNFYLTGSFFGLPERIATTIPVIVALFALGLMWRRVRSELVAGTTGLIRPIAWIDLRSTQINNGLAIALVALLIFYSVSGNVLTIAWAVEGLAVTAAGFVLRERTLRLSGLGLIALCLVKGIVIDLAGIDAIFRIVSFIVLGAILVGISFAYTRYRDVLKSYI
jgi:uncharacterized membrane protein